MSVNSRSAGNTECEKGLIVVGVYLNTTQHNTTQPNTAQHSTTQHSTAQHSTTRHDTTRHDTTQHQMQYDHSKVHTGTDITLHFITNMEYEKELNVIYIHHNKI